jgi:hypothetical protein
MLCGVGRFRTDVSGVHIGPILKCQDVLFLGHPDLWKMRTIRSPETSVQSQPTLRNVPEDDRIHVSRSADQRSRMITFYLLFTHSTTPSPSHFCVACISERLGVRCKRRLVCCEMWRCVPGWSDPDVSKERDVFFFFRGRVARSLCCLCQSCFNNNK